MVKGAFHLHAKMHANMRVLQNWKKFANIAWPKEGVSICFQIWYFNVPVNVLNGRH